MTLLVWLMALVAWSRSTFASPSTASLLSSATSESKRHSYGGALQ